MCYYFGGARSKAFAMLRKVPELLDKIKDAKSVGFWFYLAISDEVRTELVRDSSRSLRFL